MPAGGGGLIRPAWGCLGYPIFMLGIVPGGTVALPRKNRIFQVIFIITLCAFATWREN
jgi:hypothetical protein